MSNLTEEEKANIKAMQENIDLIKEDVKEIKDALMGNRISGEKGFVGRINALETRLEKFEVEQNANVIKDTKNEVYITLIGWVFKTVIVIALGIIVTEILTK